MRHRIYLIGIFIILVCFSLGILSTYISQDEESTPSPTLRPSQTNEGSRKTLLVLGVDHLDSPDPKLVSIWFVIGRFSEKEIVFFGVPVNHPVEGIPKLSLREIFAWTPEEGVAEEFIIALKSAVPSFQHDYFAVIDEICFAALLDFLGGVPVGDITLHGDQAIASQRLLWDQPEALLEFQAELISALRFAVVSININEKTITTLFDLEPSHCFVSDDSRKLSLIAMQNMPTATDQIRIEVMPMPWISSTPTSSLKR
jgi:hypothetical protein